LRSYVLRRADGCIQGRGNHDQPTLHGEVQVYQASPAATAQAAYLADPHPRELADS